MMEDTTIEPFVRNAWYVACWPDEIDNGVLARTIMNEALVLFRDGAGKAAALEDRCCHRAAPLSYGKVVENGLQCGYHGLVFDGAGKCVEIPGQANIPPMAEVRSYPVVEKNRIVWIWMGDPALADESKIVPYPWHDDTAKWPYCKEVMHIKCNYMLMIDNLMDLTHLAYVHTKTIGGNPNAHVNAKMDIERTEHGAKYIRWMDDTIPPPTYVKGAGFKGKVDRWQEFEYVVPSTVVQWSGALDVGKGARENREQDGFHLRILHAITPVTETTCIYFWSAANGYRQDDPRATVELYGEINPTFIEDVGIIEGQQARLNNNPDRSLLGIRADNALSQARRALRAELAKESGVTAQAAE